MWRRVSKEAAIEISKEVLRAIAIWAVPPGVGIMGWLQGFPWFYVAIGVILSGAGITTWLVQNDERRNRNRVEHKLMYVNMRINLAHENNLISAIGFGFHLQNSAAFPIKFKVENLTTKLTFHRNGLPTYPPKKEYQNNIISVPPGGIGFFDDHIMALPKEIQGAAEVELQCKILYGKAERFDHELELKKKTVISVNGPAITGGQQWYDQ